MRHTDMITPRYMITHPQLTPEFYPSAPLDFSGKVRGLHIPQPRPVSPEVIVDTAANIKKQVFYGSSTRCLHFPSGFYMYISSLQGVMLLGENIVATYLMRLHYNNSYGYYMPDTIYGDVCIFGSGAAYHQPLDNFDYSVPYEIVEQIIHLYEQI